jgi:tRNA threonylcarbamoyladenosine biosynthesis protein TsaE
MMTAADTYQHERITRSPEETKALGRHIGHHLETGTCIALTGELGCGKTLFTRGICEGLDVPSRQVNSPTFVLANEYRGRVPVFHLDVYRLDTEEDAVDLGITDYLARAQSGVMIVEWAEKIVSLLPDDRLMVEFERLSARQRRIRLGGLNESLAMMLKGLE